MKVNISLLFVLITSVLFAQPESVISGPMQGHTTGESIKFWMLTEGTRKVVVSLFEDENPNDKKTLAFDLESMDLESIDGQIPLHFEFEGLQIGHHYYLSIDTDDGSWTSSRTYSTLSADPHPDFSFLVGSCFFVPFKIFKIMYPAKHKRILPHMVNELADFMLWLGDNVYYFSKDPDSKQNMFKKQSKVRQIKQFNELVSSGAHFSIWDDHDYGPNNSDNTFSLRDSALDIHKMFWANPYYGSSDDKGAYYHFSWADADFFMTDGRFHRDSPLSENGSMYGEKQLNWLFQRLKNSQATFKFIISGSQILNTNPERENMGQYPKEKDELLNFIRDNQIEGVIFLTGDRHISELIKIDAEDSYPLYDFTCSPVTSPVDQGRNKLDKADPNLIAGTYIEKQNYGLISISGDEGDRTCELKVVNIKGKTEWTYSINENDLKFKR